MLLRTFCTSEYFYVACLPGGVGSVTQRSDKYCFLAVSVHFGAAPVVVEGCEEEPHPTRRFTKKGMCVRTRGKAVVVDPVNKTLDQRIRGVASLLSVSKLTSWSCASLSN